MTRIIQDLTASEIDHIIADAPRRCYSDIAHELDVGVNTVKRVVRNHNNTVVKSDAKDKVPYSASFEPSRQSSNSKRSAHSMSQRPSKRIRRNDHHYKAGSQRGTVTRYKQLTLC